MRAAGLLLGIGFAAALGLLVSAAPPPPALHAVVGPAAFPVESHADPFPLRRQFLTDDQLDRLTADPRGPFRKLTKPEFETKVRAAADAVQLARTPPQVVAAAYRGRYDPGRLTGSADWTVANTSGRPALVPLDSLRLAITELTPAADRTALLFRGKPGGKELPGSFLWVGDHRETAVAVGWSVRGVEEADEERFDLGIPPAAIATIELTLPTDRHPALTTAGGKRIEATGPFPGKSDGERVWKWAAGGLAGVVLAVRPSDTPGAEATATRTAVFDLSPGEVRSSFDFTLDSPRGLIRGHTFATDAGVKVQAVSGDGIDRWQQDPADGKAAGTLVVSWREPTASAKVKVTATAAAVGTGAATWACPGVRTTTALPGADVVEVNVPLDLKLDGWSTGDYRPAVTTTAKSLKLQFVGSFATATDGTRKPPTVRVRTADPELATEESLTWRVEPGRTRLSAVVKAKVVRGPLPQLVVKTAPGYVLESAAVVPEDPAVSFVPLAGTPNTWVVEPSRAVPTGRAVEVHLEFRGPPGPPPPDAADHAPAALPIPFPVFTPVAATDRQGTLVTVGERVIPTARTVLAVATDAGGWVVKYRGKEPSGVGLFAPEPTGVSVDAVRLAVRNKLCEATLLGRADDGPVGALTVFVPHPDGRVKATDGATAVPLPAVNLLPLLTATNGWSALAAAGTTPHGVYWRVTFPKPKTGAFEVVTTYPAPPLDPTSVLALSLPRIGGGRGDVTAELSAELAAVYRPTHGPSDDFPPVVSLEPLTVKPVAVPESGEWRFADVQHLTQIDGDGGLAVTFSGKVVASAGRTLPVSLPPNAVAESAQVGGKWTTVTPGEVVSLPLPDLPPDGLTFEVRYRLPTPPLGPLPKYDSPAPGLPVETPVATRWQFAKGWLPWPSLSDADECGDTRSLRVARSPVLRGVGFAVGGLVLAVGVRLLLKGSRWRLALLAMIVIGCGVGVWVAPLGWQKVLQPPLYAGLGVLAVVAFRRPPAPPIRRPSAVVRAAMVLAAVGVCVNAQPVGEPAVVYVVGTDAQAVYAPQSVLDKLTQLAAPPLPDVIVTRATYTATAAESTAQFDATFTLDCPRPGEHTFTLPLAGVRLEVMQLDGKDAFPDASKPDRYTLTVNGQGKHTLAVKFAVMPTTTGGDREARFGGPEVFACTVAFDAGANGRQPDVPTRRGGQTVTGKTATADHGAGRQVAVRWRETTTDGGAKTTISVKEAGVWDATDTPDAGVWAAFAYTVAGGGVDRFEIDLPAGLVATRVLVRPTDPRANPVGVRGWRVAPSGDGTRVTARLQQPADGRVLVLVRAVPAKPLGKTPVLRFPRAAVPDADRDSVYAVRFPGVLSGGVARSGTVDFPADAIVKDFPAVPEFAFDKLPPAVVVKRDPKAAAELRPTLVPAPLFAALGAEVVWTCGGWVEVEGAARVVVKDAGVVEFNLPDGVEVRDVRAVGLAGWGRTGSKVQVWLKTPAAGEVLVRWAGSLPNTGELPLPRWSSALTPAEPTVVRVRATDGFAVKLTQTTGMKTKAAAEGETAFTFEGNPPPLKVEVTAVPPASPKPADPPASKPPPPTVPPVPAGGSVNAVSPTAAAFDPWPVVGAVVWGVGLLAALVTLRSWRWRPERVAAVGVLGLLAAGVAAPLGWAFAAVAGLGLLWRAGRVVRRLL